MPKVLLASVGHIRSGTIENCWAGVLPPVTTFGGAPGEARVFVRETFGEHCQGAFHRLPQSRRHERKCHRYDTLPAPSFKAGVRRRRRSKCRRHGTLSDRWRMKLRCTRKPPRANRPEAGPCHPTGTLSPEDRWTYAAGPLPYQQIASTFSRGNLHPREMAPRLTSRERF